MLSHIVRMSVVTTSWNATQFDCNQTVIPVVCDANIFLSSFWLQINTIISHTTHPTLRGSVALIRSQQSAQRFDQSAIVNILINIIKARRRRRQASQHEPREKSEVQLTGGKWRILYLSSPGPSFFESFPDIYVLDGAFWLCLCAISSPPTSYENIWTSLETTETHYAVKENNGPSVSSPRVFELSIMIIFVLNLLPNPYSLCRDSCADKQV